MTLGFFNYLHTVGPGQFEFVVREDAYVGDVLLLEGGPAAIVFTGPSVYLTMSLQEPDGSIFWRPPGVSTDLPAGSYRVYLLVPDGQSVTLRLMLPGLDGNREAVAAPYAGRLTSLPALLSEPPLAAVLAHGTVPLDGDGAIFAVSTVQLAGQGVMEAVFRTRISDGRENTACAIDGEPIQIPPQWDPQFTSWYTLNHFPAEAATYAVEWDWAAPGTARLTGANVFVLSLPVPPGDPLRGELPGLDASLYYFFRPLSDEASAAVDTWSDVACASPLDALAGIGR